MITSRKELKEFIKEDRSRYHLRNPRIFGAVLNDESYYVTKYLYALRNLEYYKNTNRHLWNKIMYVFWFLRHRYLSINYGIKIAPNIVGKGLYIPHIVGGVIINALHVGDYCVVNSGVIIGNKNKSEDKPIIGNNVEITIGAKVIGKIIIGDNVIVAPNSVVIKDVPNNAVVSGIPAKILKFND
ncbi:MAG: serine acetyltransferase [Muribaculum sp.]|nr:serine acetyltransferase [Muribaculum sp.]